MSQRRIRGNQAAASVNYKEMYEEAEQERDELQARLDEIAAIAAPEVDHERMERVEAKLDAMIRALLQPEQIAEIEQALQDPEGEPTP